jgi:small subunit ribosomal protein S20
MANTQSAKKRARQTIRRTLRNTAIKGAVKTALRKAREAVETKSTSAAQDVKSAISVLAKAGNKGALHHRAVARKVSRLMARAAQLAKAPAPEAAVVAKAKTKSGASKTKAKTATKAKR